MSNVNNENLFFGVIFELGKPSEIFSLLDFEDFVACYLSKRGKKYFVTC